MKNPNLKVFIIFSAIVLFGVTSAFAQQSISPEKTALIREVMELTGTDKLGVKTEVSSIDFEQSLLSLIEQDKDLRDSQKQELRKLAAEAHKRVEQQLRGFNADEANSSQLLQEVGIRLFDKNFTEDELRELVVFYRTTAGGKSAKFMMTFVTDLSNAYGEEYSQKIQVFLTTKANEEIELFKARIKEIKKKKLDT